MLDLEDMNRAVEEIKKADMVRVVSHLDADGIAAAAVAMCALTREGKKVFISIEKQIKPELIEELKKEKIDLILFTDLGSGYLDLLGELKKECNCNIIIADHHHPSSEKTNLIHINPHLVSKEEDEISGAGVTYLLAKKLNPKNKDLVYLAVIGAIGDIQEEGGEMKGINKELVEEAKEVGVIKKEKGIRLFGRMNRPVHKALEYSTNPFIPGVSGNESAAIQFLSNLGIGVKKNNEWRTLNDLNKEELQKLASAIICERIREEHPVPEKIFGDVYTLDINGKSFDAKEMATSLNACGRMGQASVGVLTGLGIGSSLEKISGILAGYRKMITRCINWIRENKDKIKETDHAFYILAEDQIHENFIGTITSICEKSCIFEKNKLIFGLANTANEVKISARAPDEWAEKGLNLKHLFEKVVKDGYGGGHSKAAGAFLPKGKEEEFINLCEDYLKGVHHGQKN